MPGGRADLAALPLPRAPVGHRGLGLGLRAVPGQCNVTFTVRDERVLRVLGARQRRGRRRLAVRQGPLRLPVHPRRRAHHAADDPRRRRAAPGLLGARARRGRRRRSSAPTGRVGAIAGGETTNEEGFLLQRLMREGLGSRRPRLARRRHAAARAAPRARRARRCRRPSPTSSSPTPCSCSTASRSTTCRSSTCASARACAATA